MFLDRKWIEAKEMRKALDGGEMETEEREVPRDLWRVRDAF